MFGMKKYPTVNDIPEGYFDSHKIIFGRVEEIVDGQTFRVRHVPGYSVNRQAPTTAIMGSLESETLLVRLYGVEVPTRSDVENGDDDGAGMEHIVHVNDKARELLHSLVFRQMVQLKLWFRVEGLDESEPPGLAIAMVETVVQKSLGRRGEKPKDVSVALVRAGWARPLSSSRREHAPTNSAADQELRHMMEDDEEKRHVIENAADLAKRENRGLWKEHHHHHNNNGNHPNHHQHAH